MARMTVKLPDDLLDRLGRLGEKTEEIIERVLPAGGEVLLDKVKSNLSSVIGHGTKYKSRSAGKLVAALGISPVKLTRDGNYDVKIGFFEDRDDGVSNAMLANILEFGKSGQPAKPFLKPAVSASKKAIVEALQSALDKEVDAL